jgi:YidC/Oxa1 family membrane protein insertase
MILHLLPHVLAFSNPLRPLENLLRHLLVWFHTGFFGFSWAWSIVAITVLVRILLVPVTVRQIHSMQSLQAHAPEMKALQQKWKHDKQRQNEELMKFYKENKINPAASCLPMLIQIPIFISLYYVLKHFDQRVYSIYHGSKDWLHLVDITQPVMTGWGPLLLTIYVVSQLSSSYFMSTTMQGAQRILLMVMPLFFVVFIVANPKSFPAGLMIYWVTTNLWTTGQGLVTRRLMPKPAPPEKRSSRSPAKDEPAVASGNGAGTTPRKAAPAPTRKPVAGPPRRVKRKKGGGGAKR